MRRIISRLAIPAALLIGIVIGQIMPSVTTAFAQPPDDPSKIVLARFQNRHFVGELFYRKSDGGNTLYWSRYSPADPAYEEIFLGPACPRDEATNAALFNGQNPCRPPVVPPPSQPRPAIIPQP